jgi:hypothetical protein
MRNAYRIAAAWERFRVCIPEDAPLAQFVEIRKAFFGGAAALFVELLAALEPGVEPTEADLTMLDEVKRELVAFMREQEAS